MLSPRSNANKIYAAAGEESKNGEKKPKNAAASLRSAYIKILTPEALAVAQEKSGKILSFHSSDGGDKRSKRLHSANGSVDLPFSEFDPEAAAQKLLERRAQFWIEKPIHCGYIHAFSMSEYNSENVKFLMAIVDFQEHLDLDSTAWNNGTWQEIDRRLGINDAKETDLEDLSQMTWDNIISDKSWPSTKVQKDSVVNHVQTIWDTYFSPTAACEICISAKMRSRTVFRLTHLYLYGKEVFIEAMIDPLKTVNKDVLPRFLVSGFYHDFQMRMASVKLLPPAKDLVVHGPVSALSLTLDMDVATLEEIKKVPWRCDRVLYDAFKDYLTSIVAVELLLCVRKIANYQQLWTEARSSGTLENHPCAFADGADEAAWMIYAYFIAPGSAYEVSVSHRRRKHIQQLLAAPTEDMFDRLQEQTFAMIGHHLDRFYASRYFTTLPEVIRQEQTRLKSEAKFKELQAQRKGNCFAFLQ